MKTKKQVIGKKEILKAGISIVVSIINIFLVVLLEGWTSGENAAGMIILYMLGLPAASLLSFLFLKKGDGRLVRYAYITGLLMAFAYVLGCRMRRDGTVANETAEILSVFVEVILLGYLSATCIAPVLQKNTCRVKKANDRICGKECDEKWVFVFYFALILLCWLPVFLAYYPSVFSYDAESQMYQVISGNYSTHHPLLHTLFMGLFLKIGGAIGSYTAGMAMHSVVQMMLMAAAFASALRYLYHKRTAAIGRIILAVFFALLPTNSVLSISTTKDVLFAAFVLLYTLEIWKCINGEGKWYKTVILAVLMLLFRNNAVYALLAQLPITFFILLKKKSGICKKYLAVTMLGIVLFVILAAALKTTLKAENGSPREMLSVPLQQMARTRMLHDAELSRMDREEQEKYLSGEWIAIAYNPHLADPIKSKANIRENPKGFVKAWMKLGLAYPQEYVDAFLDNSVGYWFLEDESHSCIYGIGTASGFGYLSTDTRGMPVGYEIIPNSLLPGVRAKMEHIVSDNAYRKLPVLSVVFAPAFYWWMLVLYMSKELYEKKYEKLIPVGFLIMYYMTLLLSPTVLIRYMYPFVVTVPVLVCLATIENYDIMD